jgi:U3 small nucleolar RNA-associated protein 12
LASGGFDTYIVVYDIVEGASLYKLLGHKDVVSQLKFHVFSEPDHSIGSKTQSTSEMLISTSRDTSIKIWDLESQYCAQSIMEANQKIYSFITFANLLITGSNSSSLRVYKLGLKSQTDENSNFTYYKYAEYVGSFEKSDGERVVEISFDGQSNKFIVCSSDSIEVFKINNEREIYKKLLRAAKKQSRKRNRDEVDDEDTSKVTVNKEKVKEQVVDGNFEVRYLFSSVHYFNSPQKVRSTCLILRKKDSLILTALHSNDIIVYSFTHNEDTKVSENKKLFNIGHNCHRGALRCVTMADNDTIFVTSSMDTVKVWNADTSQDQSEGRVCTKSIECKNVISLLLLPPNKHILLGTKTGELYLYAIASNECIQTISAHKAEIWGMDIHMSPMTNDNDILVCTGSADKTLKFWSLDLVEDEESKTTQLQLSNVEEIETTDEVMGVKFSPDGRFICFSLLDSTIKICYVDTKKLFLSLYGHSLPILSFDISSDSTLLASASADKNVKLWGMDFGDCHKSIFCHDDSITTVKFVKDTHYFFTGSKDNTVKYYDGDTFDEIQVFEQSFGNVWALTLSYIGDQLITVGADSSIRVYKQTNQQLFLQEERERRLEKMMLDEGDLEMPILKAPALDQFAKDKVMKIESETALKGSLESVKYGEDLMEAIYKAELFRQD